MKKLVSLIAVLALGLGLTTVVSAPAQAADGWTFRSPFAREIVRRGDVDRNPYDIEHVRELEYRLKWVGLLKARPNRVFGRKTEAAVKAFQKRLGVPATGVADYRTWRPLIKKTVRGRNVVPRACKSAGRHACYDRWRHQVNLYRNGTLLNSWLVRGGSSNFKTRTGSFRVYWRDIDHRSSLYGSPMPYSQFFSGGQALHGSRYMMNPFSGHSHGCVNFYVEDARQLWRLTSGRRLVVHVYGGWS